MRHIAGGEGPPRGCCLVVLGLAPLWIHPILAGLSVCTGYEAISGLPLLLAALFIRRIEKVNVKFKAVRKEGADNGLG